MWRVTFTPLLQRTGFAPLMRDLLKTLEAAYAHPVDVEFTVHLDAEGNAGVNLVQCRPLATLGSDRPVELPGKVDPQRLLFASQGRFMGGNLDLAIDRVIRVDGARYAELPRPQKYAVARLVGALNRQYATPGDCTTLLIGPGRWGTSTPELGVPVRFADIDRVRILVEVADPDAGIVPDLSFGSHFFQDLVEARIAYAALFPAEADCEYHPAWLDRHPAHTPEVNIGDPVDPAVLATVQVHDTRDAALRVVADVVQQRLVCFRAGSTLTGTG